MPCPARRLLLAGVVAVALAGCGGDGEEGSEVTIPRDDADVLLETLDAAEDAVESGQCDEATAAADDFVRGVDALPAEVGTEAKARLREAGNRLEELAAAECAPEERDRDRTTRPETTETSTPAPPTTPPETTTDTEPETDEESDEDEGNQGGRGGGPPADTPGGGPPDDVPGGPSAGGNNDFSGGIGGEKR